MAKLVNQKSKAPTRKMKYAGIVGAIAAGAMGIAQYYGADGTWGPLITLVASIATGYLVRDRENV